MSPVDQAFLLGAIAGAPLAILVFFLLLALYFYVESWLSDRTKRRNEKLDRYFPPNESQE